MTELNLPTVVTEAAIFYLILIMLFVLSYFFNQHSPVRYFDDIVCELHAFKWHGLSLNTRAWAINKSLEEEKEQSVKVDSEDSNGQCNFL